MATKQWAIDPSHSEIQFKVKHLMITNVTGSFQTFSGAATTEEDDFITAQFGFTADVDSISTGNEQRDGHLKSADFFDAAQFPHIAFKSTSIENADADGNFDVLGDFTIRDHTHNIRLKVEFGGVVRDPYGQTKAGFTLTGKISRADFGLTWSAVTEAGGVVVSDDVKIHGEIQFIQQA